MDDVLTTKAGLTVKSKTLGITFKELMKDPTVQKFYNIYEAKRKETAIKWVYVLKYFLQYTCHNEVRKLLKLSDLELKEKLDQWLLSLIPTKAPKTVKQYRTAIQLFFKAIGRNIRSTVLIPHISSTPTLESEKIPSPDQLREILNHANCRSRAAISYIAFSGVRFATMVKLTLSDLLDLDIESLEFRQTPALLHVPPSASKIGKRYFTFITEEGCEYISAYLKERRNSGEILNENSPAVASNKGKSVQPKNIARKMVRDPLRQVIKARPYVLRSYFACGLLAARVHPVWQSFFMGHGGGIEAIYTTRKHLPENIVKNMRDSFKPAERELATQKRSDLNVEKVEWVRNFAKLVMGPQELEITIRNS